MKFNGLSRLMARNKAPLKLAVDKMQHRMKHLKRKYLTVVKINGEDFDKKGVFADPEKPIPKDFTEENTFALIRLERDELVGAFVFNMGDALMYLPEPHPVVMYFATAQQFALHTERALKDLLIEMDIMPGNADIKLKKIYSYYCNASIFITQLAFAVEVCMNLSIPKDAIYNGQDRDSLQWANFNKKLTEVLPAVLPGMDFAKTHPKKYDLLNYLNETRNRIVHLKTINGNVFKPVYKKMFDLELQKTLQAAKSFIDFYQPGLIEICDCGKADDF